MTTRDTLYSVEEWIGYEQDEDGDSGQLQRCLPFLDFVNDCAARRSSA